MKQILFLILLCCSELTALAQISHSMGTKYLTVNGKPTFITGANYSPSTGWFQTLDNSSTLVKLKSGKIVSIMANRRCSAQSQSGESKVSKIQ